MPGLDDYREREALAVRVAKTGVYRSPPTSGNVFRRDVADLIREIDYERKMQSWCRSRMAHPWASPPPLPEAPAAGPGPRT